MPVTKLLPILLVVLGCGAGLAIGATNARPAHDVFDLLAGKWASREKPDQCDENPHHISLSADRRVADFRLDKPAEHNGKMISEYRYSILYAEGRAITMLLNGETRRTSHGDRVVWVLILKNPTTYTWRRTDWAPSKTTADFGRCD